jgi:hypothetical protein
VDDFDDIVMMMMIMMMMIMPAKVKIGLLLFLAMLPIHYILDFTILQ